MAPVTYNVCNITHKQTFVNSVVRVTGLLMLRALRVVDVATGPY